MNQSLTHILLNEEFKSEYQKVITSGGIKDHVADVLRLQGRDTLDFLQRMSTNDVLSLQPNQHTMTVLTNEKGRIIDVVHVYIADTEIFLLTSPTNSRNVRAWLERYVVTEDVLIEDVNEQFVCLLYIGRDPSTDKNLKYKFQNPLWTLPAYHCIMPLTEFAFIQNSAELISDEMFEMLRIEQGVPLYGKELSDQINPLEAGLEKYISFTKGCYIGQEVIARLDTYKKLQKKIHGFIFEVNEPCNELGKLYYNDEPVGWTTSQTWSIALNKQVALGYVRTNINALTMDFIGNGTQVKSKVHLHTLPFTSQSYTQ